MKPNILFAFADDWGRYASAYAAHESERSLNTLINTPVFDRVAAEGVLFTNAFVQAPSCTPCRSSILAGQYFWQTGLGAILSGAVWDETIPVYPLELEKDGYFIGYSYKVWSPGRTRNAPYGADRTAYDSAGKRFNQFSQHVTKLSETMSVEEAKQEILTENLDNFKSFLDAKPDNQPFCYWWGPTNTHRHWEKGSGKKIWDIDPDTLEGKIPDFLPDVHEIREDFADYLGECLAVDAGLGDILNHLEEIGELDNTLIVVSGDHGIPGIPRGKCNLYDLGAEVALAARWPGKIKEGRVVNDFVSLMDLGPTFLDAAGTKIPDTMTGKSLLPVLESKNSGQVEADRTYVITGRERHCDDSREGFLPYPQRSIRTDDYLYIINFEPDRWPAGDPKGLDDLNKEAPAYEELARNTRMCFADMDGSPTKAWMIHHRAEEEVSPLFELSFGKRPREELYDLKKDPYYMENVADKPDYSEAKEKLDKELMKVLHEQNDPRVCETPCRYELPPYAGPVQE
ncbi:MAG: sulfatase family protein [Planctomycetota bacterium]|jgi:arylsulfatase A-like enzyme